MMITMDFHALLTSAWIWLLDFLNNLIPVYIIPNFQMILQVIVLIPIAWVAGRIIKAIVVRVIGKAGLKRITNKSWAESVLNATGYSGSIVELIGDLVKWLIYILFLALMIQVVGFPGIADVFTQAAIFMPRFIGAILLVVIGFIIADFFGKVFEEAGRRFLDEELISKIVAGMIKYSIALISLTMALALIGLDVVSLTIMFAAILVTLILIFVMGVKDMFPNFSAGLYLKKSLRPGEKIRVAEYTGAVESIDPFSLTLKTKTGRVTIPNSVLLKNPVERLSKK